VQSVGETARQLSPLGFDLTKLRTAAWNGQAVWIVGSRDPADTTSAQFWVEDQHLMVVRIVLSNGAGGIALGCSAEEYAGVQPGDIVVTLRGVCARVDRAILGEAAGAPAVNMVNNTHPLPPLEGPTPREGGRRGVPASRSISLPTPRRAGCRPKRR